MKFKTDNLYLYVEGIQFINGEYSTTDKKEIEILNRYKDSITVLKEEVKVDTIEVEEETNEIIEEVEEVKTEEVKEEITTKKKNK